MQPITLDRIPGTLNVPEIPRSPSPGTTPVPGQSFGDFVKSAIQNVDDLQHQSDRVIKQFLAGEGPDIHTVILAANKADLSFQLMMQIRNKLVQAYQEIMRIQV